MAKIVFLSYRRETEKKMSLLKAVLQSALKVRRLLKILSQIGLKMTEIAFLSYRRKTEKKCHF